MWGSVACVVRETTQIAITFRVSAACKPSLRLRVHSNHAFPQISSSPPPHLPRKLTRIVPTEPRFQCTRIRGQVTELRLSMECVRRRVG